MNKRVLIIIYFKEYQIMLTNYLNQKQKQMIIVILNDISRKKIQFLK